MSRHHKYLALETELQWLFGRADSDCNIKSNYGAMIAASICPPDGNLYTDPYHDGILTAIQRRRPLERALYRLSPIQQKALYAIHGYIPIHPYVARILGDKAALSYLLMVPDALEKLCTKAITSTLTNTEKILLAQIRIQQLNTYITAITSFQQELEKENKQ